MHVVIQACLPQELSRLRRERDELHLQYAREIEAVHAQVGAREAELSSEHGSQIQQLREQHERGTEREGTLHLSRYSLIVYSTDRTEPRAREIPGAVAMWPQLSSRA